MSLLHSAGALPIPCKNKLRKGSGFCSPSRVWQINEQEDKYV